jgi:hypothetical protein
MTIRYMMGTKAFHKLGDISRDEPDLVYVHDEDDMDYIGNWATGFGFVNVHFPKESTRELTSVEQTRYSKLRLEIAGRDCGPAVPKELSE